MKRLKNQFGLIAAAGLLVVLSGCSSTQYAGSGRVYDDLYGYHNREAIARAEAAEREQARLAAEAAAKAAAERDVYLKNTGNPYEDILADTYDDAYARRLRGFESPSYRMPSSYYNYRYSDASFYASAYDPAFYNVIVMGDEVWVEPKYISSMFGTWGSPRVNFNFGWGYSPYWNSSWYWGWNNPYWDYYWGWNYPYSGWGWNWGWNWGRYPHNNWWNGGHWGAGNWNRPGSGNRPSVTTRPTYRTSGGSVSPSSTTNRGSGTSSGSGTTYRNRTDRPTVTPSRSSSSNTDYNNRSSSSGSYNSGRSSSSGSSSSSGGYTGGGSSSSGGGGYTGGGSSSGGGGRGR